MSHTNFNMRLENDLRASAYSVLEEYGITPSQAVRMFFNQIAKTGKIPLTFDWAENIPNQETIAAIEAVERGEVTSYENATSALKDMHEIANQQ